MRPRARQAGRCSSEHLRTTFSRRRLSPGRQGLRTRCLALRNPVSLSCRKTRPPVVARRGGIRAFVLRLPLELTAAVSRAGSLWWKETFPIVSGAWRCRGEHLREKMLACPGLSAGNRWRTDHLLWTPWGAATLNGTEPVMAKLNRSFYGATAGHDRYVAVAFRPFAMVPQSQRPQPQRYLARCQCDSVTILLGNQPPCLGP